MILLLIGRTFEAYCPGAGHTYGGRSQRSSRANPWFILLPMHCMNVRVQHRAGLKVVCCLGSRSRGDRQHHNFLPYLAHRRTCLDSILKADRLRLVDSVIAQQEQGSHRSHGEFPHELAPLRILDNARQRLLDAASSQYCRIVHNRTACDAVFSKRNNYLQGELLYCPLQSQIVLMYLYDLSTQSRNSGCETYCVCVVDEHVTTFVQEVP